MSGANNDSPSGINDNVTAMCSAKYSKAPRSCASSSGFLPRHGIKTPSLARPRPPESVPLSEDRLRVPGPTGYQRSANNQRYANQTIGRPSLTRERGCQSADPAPPLHRSRYEPCLLTTRHIDKRSDGQS